MTRINATPTHPPPIACEACGEETWEVRMAWGRIACPECAPKLDALRARGLASIQHDTGDVPP